MASLNASWREHRPDFDAAPAIRRANERIYAEMARDSALRGMGATVVGLHLRGAECSWFNVGDSRTLPMASGAPAAGVG